ncbi:MFS transporter [Prescottella equi]|uniref:Transporter, major facilitator family protein n=1 Tax=Prescottella equi ATCC 33707 TaxID=525370 RepID=E9T571_RHOHA|nr:MFS transporter [Prescottella equi]EGD22702.1 transporter, major facilitator family protein [Prescottella equi ATCC 33707]MBU4615134.1 MFS transporter [Rhodococcus sp. GG48]
MTSTPETDQTVATSTTPDRAGAPRPRRRAAAIVLMLFGFLLLNYADKVVVGITGIPIIKELGITREQFGLVQSSFFWLFAVGAIIGGLLLTRIPARWLLAGVALLWVVSLAPLMGSVTFGVLIASRVLLGFAEGPATAMATTVVHSWFPADKRALPTSIVQAGAGIGAFIASPTLTWLLVNHSWHAPYIALVAVGIVWAVLWVFVGGTGEYASDRAQAHTVAGPLPDRVPYLRLFGSPTILGLLVLFFTTYCSTALKVSWLPLYLQEGLGYTTEESGILVALPYVAAAVIMITAGAISGWLTGRGMTSRVSRCLFASGLAVTGGISTLAFALMDRSALQMFVIVVGASAAGASYGLCFSALSDVVPARQRGVVMSVVVAVYSLGGLAAPLMLGRIIDSAETVADGYARGFVILGIVVVVGGVVSAFTTNPERDAARFRRAAGMDPALAR